MGGWVGGSRQTEKCLGWIFQGEKGGNRCEISGSLSFLKPQERRSRGFARRVKLTMAHELKGALLNVGGLVALPLRDPTAPFPKTRVNKPC